MSSMTDQVETPPERARRGGGVGKALAIIVGIVLVIAGLTALVWGVARSTDTVTDSFSDVETVVVSVNGQVDVRAGDSAEVEVTREWVLFGRPDVELALDGGTLRVEADCGVIDFGCRTHVDAVVPAGAELVVETAAGNVSVAGLEGGVDLTTSAGNVTLEGVSGPATLRSSAGRIEGDVTDGDVDAETSAGGIELDVSGEFSRISAVTSAGSVALTVPDRVYRVEADTSAGNVQTNVATDPDADREIVARSSAGSIRIDPAQAP